MGRLTLPGRLSLAWNLLWMKSSEYEQLSTSIFPGGSTTPGRKNTSAIIQAYAMSPWLRAVVSKICSAIAGTRWYVMGQRNSAGRWVRNDTLQRANWLDREVLKEVRGRLRTKELVTFQGHPLMSLLEPQDGLLAGINLPAACQLYLELAGESVIVTQHIGKAPGYPGSTDIESLWIIPPTWVTRTPDTRNQTFDLSYGSPLTYLTGVPTSEVIWFRQPNPVNPYLRGSGIAGAVGDELDTDEYAAKTAKTKFFNQARPDLVVSVDDAEPDQRALEIKWNQKLQGFMRASRPFFTNKRVTVHPIPTSFVDLQLADLRRFERDTVVQTWGFPPEILGILENSNKATVDAAERLFARWVQAPRLEFLRKGFQPVLERWDDRLILAFENPILEDREFALKVGRTASWAITLDEWRELGGWDAVGPPWGDMRVMPLNMTPVTDPSKLPEPVDEEPPVDDDEDADAVKLLALPREVGRG